MSTRSTKKIEHNPDTLRSEYQRKDLGKGVRGKYAKRFKAGTNLVLLSPDVANAFPDSDSVNDALRNLLHVAERAANKIPDRQDHRD